jgi:Xaa-Pro aminopeptidase
MLDAARVTAIQQVMATLDETVDGWLLFDFRGINPILGAVAGGEVIGSRRQYLYIPRVGPPVAVLHAIDAELWREWPAAWPQRVWVQRDQLAAELSRVIAGRTVAMEYSPGGAVPYGDYIPAGTLEFVRQQGARVVSSAELVTRCCSVWSAADLASHVRAAERVATIARQALTLAGERARGTQPMTEYELMRWVLEAFGRAGLVTDSNPSVSFGANAARIHYEPTDADAAAIVPGRLLLLDLWAREPTGIYADQTWMASVGAPEDRAARMWNAVMDARDAAIALLDARLAAGEPVRGAEADAAARRVIVAAGYGDDIRCRTGHSIDRVGLHGYGPTLDDTESYDARRIVPGAGFSIEPGLYIAGEIGVRTEVNAHARSDGLDVTPREYQRALLEV